MSARTLDEAVDHMNKAVAALAHEFAGVRTGRASGAILEKITVEYYGVSTPLLQIASVSAPEPQMLVISPYDRTAMNAIEKAILALTEERRKDLAKLCRHYAEESRVAVRNIRRDINDALKRQEKDGEISQDDLRRLETDVQKATDAHIKDIDDLLRRKEQEIMEV